MLITLRRIELNRVGRIGFLLNDDREGERPNGSIKQKISLRPPKATDEKKVSNLIDSTLKFISIICL